MLLDNCASDILTAVLWADAGLARWAVDLAIICAPADESWLWSSGSLGWLGWGGRWAEVLGV